MIAPSDPGAPVRRGQQRIDLLGLEEADVAAMVSLARDGQDALDQLGVLWMAKGGIAVERADGGQAGVAGAGAVVPLLLEMGEEGADQAGVDVGHVQLGGSLPGAGLGEGEQHPQGVAIGADRARAGLTLGEQVLGEPGLNGGGERAHRRPSSKRSSRFAANPSSSGQAWR